MAVDITTMPMREQIELAKQLLWSIAEDGATSQCLRTDLHRAMHGLTIESLRRLPKKGDSAA